MQFNSLIFLFFFLPLFLLLYYTIRREYGKFVLIVFSLFFYGWGQREAVFILIILIILNYYLGVGIAGSKKRKNSKKIYITGLILNVIVLIFYKYLTFFLSMFGVDFRINGLPYPTGISFMTFLAVSYLTDIYREVISPAKNLSSYALYVSFFPKLITGPITLYSSFASRLKGQKPKLEDIADGIRRFIIGFGKKVIIADSLSLTVNRIFVIPFDRLGTPVAWIGIIAYTLQIYYDFSGYSDMAIGLGRMIGFRIPENFNYPYLSVSIKEFWNRWHITLGVWLKTYLFLPIAYKVMRMTKKPGILKIKIETWAYITAILTTFALCGLWHGAAWTFIAWGIYYGLLLAIEHIGVRKYLKRKLPLILRISITQFFVMIGWVIFRSPDLHYASGYLKMMFGFGGKERSLFGMQYFLNIELVMILIIAIAGSFPIISYLKKIKERVSNTVKIFLLTVENIFLTAVMVIGIMAITAGTYQPFIYFRF